MRRTVGTAWMAERALATMATEAARTYPCETGGVLLGYWSVPHSEVVVTGVVGPGPRAIHEPTRFVPDGDYQEVEIARRYRADPGRNAYLGDWHSHPHGGDRLSPKDRRTLRAIAMHEAARAPIPLMAILAQDAKWQVSVWRFQPAAIQLLGFQGRVSRLQLWPFGEN